MTTKERAKLRNIVGRLQVILEDLEALQKMAIINKKRLCHEHCRRRPPEPAKSQTLLNLSSKLSIAFLVRE
jgi:hypothetical protein